MAKEAASIAETIEALPQDDGWKLLQPLSLYQGYWFLPAFLEGAVFAQQNFMAQPGDIFLCSAPKTGTTWLKALSFATVTRSKYARGRGNENPLLTKVSHDCIPHLEKDCIGNRDRDRDLPLWSSHLSFSCLPESIKDSGCKIVYIWRDPKDTFIWMWHFAAKFRSNNELIPTEEALELFCKGTSMCGPYWDHVLGYWKESLERPDKVLFIKYEEMMEDTALHLKKLAEFMGYPFSPEEEAEGVVQEIVEFCSFDHLSNLEVNKTGKLWPDRDVPVVNSVLFRKGEVGDWRNYLSLEMAEKLDQITRNKFMDSGLI